MELPTGGTIRTDANVSGPAVKRASNRRDSSTTEKRTTDKSENCKTSSSSSSGSNSSSTFNARHQAKYVGRRNDESEDGRPY